MHVAVCQIRKQDHHLVGIRGDRTIVMSMTVVGPLQVPPPVGEGETHVVGPDTPTCVDREVFSSNEKNKISGEVNRDKTDKTSLVSSRRTHLCVGV